MIYVPHKSRLPLIFKHFILGKIILRSLTDIPLSSLCIAVLDNVRLPSYVRHSDKLLNFVPLKSIPSTTKSSGSFAIFVSVNLSLPPTIKPSGNSVISV